MQCITKKKSCLYYHKGKSRIFTYDRFLLTDYWINHQIPVARLDADARCSSGRSHDRNSQSANPRRNLDADAIRPVTEKAARYFILTSRWTESAARCITIRRTTVPSRRIAPRRTMTFIVSLSILRPQSINPGLDSRSPCALAPSITTIGGNFLPALYSAVL